MAMSRTEIETMIREAFPDARVEVKDLAGDGNHYAASVVSAAFKGKSKVQAAPDGLCRAQGQDGRRTARAGADDVGELTRTDRSPYPLNYGMSKAVAGAPARLRPLPLGMAAKRGVETPDAPAP